MTEITNGNGFNEQHDKFMDGVVHIPIFACISIAALGTLQYGPFGIVLLPFIVAVSIMLSRSQNRIIKTWNYRRDVSIQVLIVAIGCFFIEAYGVHEGFTFLNELNAKWGNKQLSESGVWIISIVAGVLNVISRRGYVTGMKGLSSSEVHRAERRIRISSQKQDAKLAAKEKELRELKIEDDHSSEFAFMNNIRSRELRDREEGYINLENARKA